MPVVEPYAISDPFSTAGKVNMNYQIMPFSSITRATAIEAVLRPEQILAVNAADGQNYKYYGLGAKNPRYYLDMDQTLLGFTNRFNSNDVFHSASEICSLWLVPEGQTYSGMQAFWSGSNSSLTGDNSREHPYADIYPVFIGANVARASRAPFTTPVTPGHHFEGRPAIQVSRRNSSAQSGLQKVGTKILKVLDYLEKLQ